MSSVIEKLEREQLRRLPEFRPGDRVRVHLQVVEGSRRRTQIFEGVVIARSGHGVRETVTVRKQSFGVGVERVFPLHSPKIEKIEVAGRGDVRRAKLYYLRDRIGKRARVRERTDLGPEQEIQRELLEGPLPVEEEVVDIVDEGAIPEAEEGVEAPSADAVAEGEGGGDAESPAEGDAPASDGDGEPAAEEADVPETGPEAVADEAPVDDSPAVEAPEEPEGDASAAAEDAPDGDASTEEGA